MARCEDYPCCGHGTEGCDDRPEFTAEYWDTLRDHLGDEDYERYIERLEAQENGW
jgi:hypothetical protein